MEAVSITEKEKRTAVFETMPVRRAVLSQIMPAIASQMISLIYSLADTYFVGLLNAPAQTAAVTVASTSYLLFNATSSLFGVGGASSLARALGRKEPGKASQISGVAFWWALLVGVVISAVYGLLARPILTVCGATEETFALTLAYARWIYVVGGPFTVMNLALANLVRAEGDASHASFGVSMGGLLNIVLDPFFVLPRFLGLGAPGAGLATAISNAASAVYFLLYISTRGQRSVLSLSPRNLRYSGRHIPEILKIGFPSALQFALTAVSVSAQMHFVSKYATEAVAGLGIVKKLDQLPLFFAIGVATGLLPMLAYNHAAGNEQRRRQAFRFGVSLSLFFSLLCLVCYELFAPTLASLFIDDLPTITYAAAFLRRMVLAMPLMSVCYPMIIQFQAMGRARESLVCSILRKGVLDIPLLMLLDRLLPLYGCMFVQPIVDA
ncbi:MAG: MATE family efflux transporter, partial [Oscillospiraceae bacterium]|nr:MATE family efflux transporter [Oscillospiraceae bacterium]